ncbi:cupin domain-containing protein [bacterium]|nr:cupin domain-containing protein [candidate division CSSED10-310 bacterium]
MIVKNSRDVPVHDVRIEGAQGVRKAVLLGESDGAVNFIMREFRVAPGGYTPFHRHNFEHEVYVIRGQGVLRTDDGDRVIRTGTVCLVIPDRNHQFLTTGTEELVFLCIIPKP